MNLKILNSKEKKNIINILKEQYGFEGKLDYVFLMNKKNKIYVVTSEISGIDIDQLKINSLGIYFGELYKGSVRLSIEGSQIVGKYASKNVLEISDDELQDWIKGLDIQCTKEFLGFVVVKNKNDFYSCGKTKEGKLLNYLPKVRTLKVINQ